MNEQEKVQPLASPVPVSEVQRVIALVLELPRTYLGLSRRALQQAQSVAIIALKNCVGLTYPELARMFGRADGNLAKLAKKLQQGHGHDVRTTQSWLHAVMAQCKRTKSVRRVIETVSQVSGLPSEAILRWQDIDRGGKIGLYVVSQCCRVLPPRSRQTNLRFPSTQGLSQAAIERAFGFADNFRAFQRYAVMVPKMRQRDSCTDWILRHVEYNLGLRVAPPLARAPAVPNDKHATIHFTDIRAIVARHCHVRIARLILNERKLERMRMAAVYIGITHRLAAPHQLFAFSGLREAGLRNVVRTHVPKLQKTNRNFATRLTVVETRVTPEMPFRSVIQLVADAWACDAAHIPYDAEVVRARRLTLFALGESGNRADVTFAEGARRLGLGRNKLAVASARQALKRRLGREPTLSMDIRTILEEIGLPYPESWLASGAVRSGRLNVQAVLDVTATALGVDAALFSIDPRTARCIRWTAVYLCKERGLPTRHLVEQSGYSTDQLRHICNHCVPEVLRRDAVYHAYVNAVRKCLPDDAGWDSIAATAAQHWDAPPSAARHHPQLAIGRQIALFILRCWRHILTTTLREAERRLGYERGGWGKKFTKAFRQKLHQDADLAWLVFRIEHQLGHRPQVLHDRYGLGLPMDANLSQDAPWRVAFEHGAYTVSKSELTPQLPTSERPDAAAPKRQLRREKSKKTQRRSSRHQLVVRHKHFGTGTVVKFDQVRNVITVAFHTGVTKTLVAEPRFFDDLSGLQWLLARRSAEELGK